MNLGTTTIASQASAYSSVVAVVVVSVTCAPRGA
ncbi:hypothetical protein RAHE111665_16825 [Rariglobus hedericola]